MPVSSEAQLSSVTATTEHNAKVSSRHPIRATFDMLQRTPEAHAQRVGAS